MRFHTTLQLDGKTATGLVVPEEVIARVNAGKRPRVEVTVNGYTFQTTIGVMRGEARVPVSADRREGASADGLARRLTRACGLPQRGAGAQR